MPSKVNILPQTSQWQAEKQAAEKKQQWQLKLVVADASGTCGKGSPGSSET